MSERINAQTWAKANANVNAVLKAGKEGGQQGLKIIGIEAVNVTRILVTHIWPPSSTPGEPPALRTGGLRGAIDWETGGGKTDRAYVMWGVDASRIQPIAGGSINYGSFLEMGTSKMAARPFMRPGTAIVTPTITPTLVKSIATAQRAAAAGLRGVQ